MHVSEIMTPNPEHLSSGASMWDAAGLMKSKDIGCVPVADNGHVVGIVTDRDIVVRGLANNIEPNSPLLDIMTPDVLTVSPTDDVDETFRLMEKEQIRRLPVVDGSGALVGMVSLGDLATRIDERSKGGETLESISEPG